MRKRDQTHVTLPAKLCELAPLNRSGVTLDRKKMEDRTSLPSDYLPRDQVRVVFHFGENH